ncbi:DUF6557 family protein [Carboxylicivirga caseinilyticus]|uniref:DUF6557 family protein n=1 Tax=Carboxylicivirga caseinilyticus TaxID=3417572 RepID=UPI003D350E72|nr:hypothetical protein [Marinilabiliaceae bacterium A049]
MKLFELIKQFQWSELEVRLPELYPDQEKDLEGFKKAFARLQSLAPLESIMTILVTPIKEDCDEVEYAHVNGCKTNPEDEEENKMTYSLMITQWPEWLGMEVSEEAFKYYGELDTLVHILWEMTFVGYKEESAAEFDEELRRQDLDNKE